MREISRWPDQQPSRIANIEPDYVYSPEDKEPTLRDYWKMLAKRRRLVILVLLAAFGIGAYLNYATTPLYTASTTLKIDPSMPSEAGPGATTGINDEYFQTQVALLKSRALAARVIVDQGLESNPKFITVPNLIDQLFSRLTGHLQSALNYVFDYIAALWGSAPRPVVERPSSTAFELGVHPRLVGRYQSFLTVEPVRSTRLVRVSFTTIDPNLSRELASAHAATFIRKQLETRFELTKEAREFLEKKLAELKDNVEKSEQALQRFRQSHGVVSLAGGENIVVDRMVDINRRLTEARARRIELESLASLVKGKNVEYLSPIVNNTLIVQLKGRLEGLEAERAQLATIFKSGHPRLLELDQQVTEARRRLNLEVNSVVRSVESDYNAASAREAALQAEAEQQQRAALNFKELGVDFTLLQGELDAHRAVYDNVARRLNESAISSDSPITNIQVTEPAERPLGPSHPQTQRNLMLSVAFGLFLGVGLAFVVEHFDSSMRTSEDVWRAAAVPTLGVVPHLKSLGRRDYGSGRLGQLASLQGLTQRGAAGEASFSQAITLSHPQFSFLAESYRAIRTILLLGQWEKPPQVILVTSAHPGEGKTITALNLAIALAQSGRTVVVVDADLRKGNCHTYMGLQNRYGLTHILTDSLPPEVGLQSTALAGLSLLPRGVIPDNPTDLLGSSNMKEVLTALRERFDFVLIDTPPALAISDAAVLSQLCDGVLLVVRNQSTTTHAVRHMAERLQAVGARILGAVLNGIDIRGSDYADYRSYSSYHAAARREERKQDAS